jgi:hypothetical protein
MVHNYLLKNAIWFLDFVDKALIRAGLGLFRKLFDLVRRAFLILESCCVIMILSLSNFLSPVGIDGLWR